jgi:hypothetical protein
MLTIVDAQNRKLEPQRCNEGCSFQTIVWPWLVNRSGFGICLKHCKLPSWKFQLSNWISGTMLLEFAIDQIRTHGSQLNQRDDHAINPPSKNNTTKQRNWFQIKPIDSLHFFWDGSRGVITSELKIDNKTQSMACSNIGQKVSQNWSKNSSQIVPKTE